MTTTLNSNNVSDYNSRIALIEVAGVFPSNVMRKNPYTIKVPISRLSQTLQRISRAGGKVKSVTIQSPSYGEVNSGVSSPELRVVDVPANPVSSPTNTVQITSTPETPTVENHHTETTENQSSPIPENHHAETPTVENHHTEATENQSSPIPENHHAETPTVEHPHTEATENQPIPIIPEIDSDEYAANIGGDTTTIQLLPGLGVKLPKTTKTKKATKKTAGKQKKQSKQKHKN
ncbi:phycobilisome linker polypeptide [Calothrix rhizosoleniae]